MERIKNIIIGCIIGAIIIILCYFLRSCQDKTYTVEQYNALNDSLIKKINSKGQEESNTKVITGFSIKDFLKLNSKDSAVILLQEQVKKYRDEIKHGGNVTVIDNSTELTQKIVSHIIDSLARKIRRGDTIFVYPTYNCGDSSRWYKYSMLAGMDSCKIKIRIDNEYSVVVGDKRDKWYKKKYPFVEVTNMNPYTKTKTLKTFEVKDTRKTRFGVGVGIGVGVTPKQVVPCIFGGVYYTIIKL